MSKIQTTLSNIQNNDHIYKKNYIYFHLKQKRFERLNWTRGFRKNVKCLFKI